MDKIEMQVLELVGELAGIDPKKISLLCKFEDLNLDSVAIVELIFSLEEKFNISIPFEGLDESELKKNFHTVSSLINHLRELLQRNV
ncbi:phosphopantetheine-binding protein [Paracoccaceae bacterium]|jgi:acyl carrier protein|nr:phosphopantetheine-binding protein [Paracoccaceae bacterium]|tara:strand:- start:210 stop:470 length:261 start_codon:yes stop_codon:yes gene_type:complete